MQADVWQIQSTKVGRKPCERLPTKDPCISRESADSEIEQREAPYTPTGNGLVCVSALSEMPVNLPCSSDISPVYQ